VKNKAELDQLIAKAEEELAKLNIERAKVIDRLKKMLFEKAQIDRPPSQLPLFSKNRRSDA
jgi:hypothetical protein